MIDWDRMVNGPVQAQFGEPAQFLPAAGAAFGINGTFHEAYKAVDLVGGTGLTTEMPALGVQLFEFEVPPRQKDRVVITPTKLHGGGTYVVKEVQSNGVGLAILLLNYVGP